MANIETGENFKLLSQVEINPKNAGILQVPDTSQREPGVANWVTSFNWDTTEGRALIEDPEADDLTTLRFAKVLDHRKPLPSDHSAVVRKQFGRFVKAMRRELGLNDLELARAANIDPTAMALLEMGQLRVHDELDQDVVCRVAGALNINVRDLVVNPLEPRP